MTMSQPEPRVVRGGLRDRRSAPLVRPQKGPPALPAATLAGVIVLVNAGLVLWAETDGGWGALGIAVMIGPTVNLGLIAGSLLVLPLVRERCEDAPLTSYVLVALLLPLAAIVIDFLIIGSLSLHGC